MKRFFQCKKVNDSHNHVAYLPIHVTFLRISYSGNKCVRLPQQLLFHSRWLKFIYEMHATAHFPQNNIEWKLNFSFSLTSGWLAYLLFPSSYLYLYYVTWHRFHLLIRSIETTTICLHVNSRCNFEVYSVHVWNKAYRMYTLVPHVQYAAVSVLHFNG